MIWYFYQSQNKITEKKGNIKQKEKEKVLPLARGKAHLSSRPSPRSPPCRLPPRAAKQLGGAAPTPWTPPRRPGASRPPQDSKERHGDALDSLSHFPPSPLRPEPSPSFPLLPRERPPLIVVRSRSQRQEE